jgi:hypothetical protein
MRNQPSEFVHRHIAVAERRGGVATLGGYLYGISPEGLSTIDVNVVLGASSPFPEEQEIAVFHEIPIQNILCGLAVIVMEREVTITCDGSLSRARLEWTDQPPWRVVMHLPGLSPVESSGEDLFACLSAIRQIIDRNGWHVCVEGARTNAWPSRMSSQMGGARMVYILSLGRQARHSDLRFIFDDAPCETVGSVEEQRAFSERWLESLRDER